MQNIESKSDVPSGSQTTRHISRPAFMEPVYVSVPLDWKTRGIYATPHSTSHVEYTVPKRLWSPVEDRTEMHGLCLLEDSIIFTCK